MAGQTQASNAACVETSPVDPAAYLDTRALRLPLLALYPVSFATSERTMQYERFSVTYRLDYLLPSLTWEQHRRIGALTPRCSGVGAGIGTRRPRAARTGTHRMLTRMHGEVEGGQPAAASGRPHRKHHLCRAVDRALSRRPAHF